MPSWNIHTAHVERLLDEVGPEALGVRDANAFLVGNLLPDTYVGFMVPNATHRINYKLTHHALRARIPLPDYGRYWASFVEGPGLDPSDVELGAWAHLVCDCVYNARTRDWLERLGRRADDAARIDKQADFALFGRTLPISMVPRVDGALLAQCREFGPYEVAEEDVRATVEVAARVVRQNQETLIQGVPDYVLLTPGFFRDAGEEAHRIMVEGLTGRMRRRQ